MVTTIVLLIAFSLAFICGGFVAFKGVQLGLRWQIQTAKQEQPTLEVKNPVKEFVEQKKLEQRSEEQVNILQEWLNGAEESR